MKLRFSGGHDHSSSGPHKEASYRRKAPSQVRRDRTRLHNHKQNRTSVPGRCLPTPACDDNIAHVNKTDCDVIRADSSGPVTRLRSAAKHDINTDPIEQSRNINLTSDTLFDISTVSLDHVDPPDLSLLSYSQDSALSPSASSFTPSYQASPIMPVVISDSASVDNDEVELCESRCGCTHGCEHGPGDLKNTCSGPHYVCEKCNKRVAAIG